MKRVESMNCGRNLLICLRRSGNRESLSQASAMRPQCIIFLDEPTAMWIQRTPEVMDRPVSQRGRDHRDPDHHFMEEAEADRIIGVSGWRKSR